MNSPRKTPSITRKLEFDAGHRVMNHEAKCATMHGHRYVVEVTAEAAELDTLGRVIDFSVLKQKLGTWFDEQWDHTVIIFEDDVKTLEAFNIMPGRKAAWVSAWNPTAENMADYILHELCPELLAGTGVKATRVVVYETPNCKAEACL